VSLPTVVVGATQVPFQHGGAEWHAAALLCQLRARGFRAELVQLPFQWDPREAALRSALAWRLLDFTQAGGLPVDLFIGTRFPSYAARHPAKVVDEPQAFWAEDYQPFVLSVGRLVSLKRVDLLLRAMSHLPPAAEARIVGEGPERAALETLAGQLGLGERVRFLGRLGDAETRALYARAGAVFYAPWDEDYGLVTLEAFQARRPVVTTHDTGGPLEFVSHEVTGLVAEPTPESVAAALARLLREPGLARRLGEAGHAAVAGLSWGDVVSALTGWAR